MNQNFEPYKSMTPGKKVVELRKLANDFGKQPSDVDTFLAGLVDSCDCQSGFADAVLKIFEKAWKQADLKGMEMYMNLFRAFTGLEFSDFLNSAYIMATIRAQERAAEDPKEWARVGKSRAIDQKDGWFSSHWKSGFTTTSPCRVDVRTRQVIAIVPFDSSCEKDLRGLWWTADYETVEANGEQHAVQNIDIITSQNAPADVYRELLAMEKAKAYWYSASGLDFYEELIKAHEAVQIVPESEESDEAPAGTTTWYIPATWSMSGYVQVQAESAKEAVRTAQEHVDEFDLPQNAQYVEDSFDIDEVAQPIPEIVLKDAGENNRPILPRDSGDIVTGLFVSHWNSGTQVVAPCDVNLKSREINNICAWFGPAEDEGDQFIRETVTVNGQEYPVQNIDDLVVGLEPAEAYESLVRIKENPSPQFWYSLNGRSLEGEIAKTKNAAEADSEDDSDTEIVHGLFTSRWDDGSVIVTGCKVDIQSRRIVEIEPSSDSCEDGSLLYETVTIHGEENPARNLDDIVGIEGAKEVYNELLRMKGNLEFWYSWSGLNFYEELVKAHLAAYPLHLCDQYCDSVTLTVEDAEHHFFEYHTDEDEVYIFNRSEESRGKRIGGVLADAVRFFAKNQMQLNPGRWTSPVNPEN